MASKKGGGVDFSGRAARRWHWRGGLKSRSVELNLGLEILFDTLRQFEFHDFVESLLWGFCLLVFLKEKKQRAQLAEDHKHTKRYPLLTG